MNSGIQAVIEVINDRKREPDMSLVDMLKQKVFKSYHAPSMSFKIVETLVYYDMDLCMLIEDEASKEGPHIMKHYVVHHRAWNKETGDTYYAVAGIFPDMLKELLTGKIPLINVFASRTQIGIVKAKKRGDQFIATGHSWHNYLEDLHDALPNEQMIFFDDEFTELIEQLGL